MENETLLRKLKDIGFYHELALQKCRELEKEVNEQVADSSATCKKTRKSRKQKSKEFSNSEACRQVVAQRNLKIQKSLKKP